MSDLNGTFQIYKFVRFGSKSRKIFIGSVEMKRRRFATVIAGFILRNLIFVYVYGYFFRLNAHMITVYILYNMCNAAEVSFVRTHTIIRDRCVNV